MPRTTSQPSARGLAALDWREGGNLRIDWRWTGSDPALFERYAAELVASGRTPCWHRGSPSVVALRRLSGKIPIVFTMVSDPVGQGFVESLANPGGNVTGFSDFNPLMAGKWLEILTQMTPPVAQVAVLYNPATAPYAGRMMRAIEEAAPTFAVAVRAAPCRDEAEIDAKLATLAQQGRGGLLVLTDLFNIVHRDAIIRAAAQHRLPTIYFARSFTSAGGLMSYGIDYADHVPAFGHLCRSRSERRQPARPAGAGADQIRARDQPQDREGARHHHLADAARATADAVIE